jgi:antitoxin VapB
MLAPSLPFSYFSIYRNYSNSISSGGLSGQEAAIWHMLGIGHGMTLERHVKLFKNGRNQAVRIPREFELPGEDAIMRKEGQRLIIEPAPPRSLIARLATLKPLKEGVPPIPDPVPDPVDL